MNSTFTVGRLFWPFLMVPATERMTSSESKGLLMTPTAPALMPEKTLPALDLGQRRSTGTRGSFSLAA